MSGKSSNAQVIANYAALETIIASLQEAPFQTPEDADELDDSSCPPMVRVLQSLLISATFIVALFASLRVYAIWSRDWRPALPIFILALVTPVANLTNIAPNVYSHNRIKSLTVNLIVVIAERVTTTAYDALVLIFTLMKTAQVRKAAMSLNASPSLMALILRDGTMYFLLLVLMNIAQIAVAAKIPSSDSTCDDTTETVVMSTGFPSIHLSTGALGNMGAPLYSGFETDTAEEMGDEKVAGVDEPLMLGLLPGLRHADIELRDVA
ncbi:hypothetical protein GY45DRAFT_1337037 [Cubamyces sp. BRFM 1775]|nr:hypothetical protein GY45DRAFT_1337037 [Cubamyces sp. BRFM 1775]